jgi:hypothetical protein
MADGGDGNVVQFPAIADPIEDEIYAKPEPPKAETESAKVLLDAYALTEGDRHQQHGSAEKCHAEIAKLWTWWTGFQIDAHDVAMMMDLLKTARIKTGGANRDCYVDKCGYSALAWRVRKD